MCIIIVKPAGEKLPSIEILKQCKIRNKDGFGFVVPNKEPFKTLKFEEFISELKNVTDDQPCIIHFRFATHGKISKKNSHPFKIENIAFAHNGVLKVENLEGMTDSETAFKYILHPAIETFGFASKGFEKTIASIIGGSKFAFLTDKGTIKIYGQFITSDGLYYSNENFRPAQHYYKPSKHNAKSYIDEMYPQFSERYDNFELNH